jgi:cell division transport system permease protein
MSDPTASSAPLSAAEAARASARPPPLLPPAPKGDRPLFFVIAVIVGLACAFAIVARAAWSAADAWTADLQGAMTVQVHPSRLESGEAVAVRAAAALAAVPGVKSARALTRQDIEDLLRPWLGDAGPPADAALPGLVDIRLERVAPAKPNDLLAALDAAGIEAVVDDHQRWAAEVQRAAGAARTLSLTAFAILVGAAAAVTSFATRASLAARSDVVEVLHLVGATDAFIARAFTRRFLSLGVRAGLLGAALAALAALAAVLLTQGGEDLLPRFRFARADAIILALAPVASAAVAALTARETVRAALGRMP